MSVGYVVSNISPLELGYQLTSRQRRPLSSMMSTP
ncbi:hypothetical protein FAES_0863 [Fibrella aestuarina BUZ 2]|uniref:Uncharacterized protein n=1 Tax=Fibrella aestuarina BUZ 2 TaxID=1166018 RepID=I0K421_9BACT|nr:hypothetical protein FAES_0863 [Fibrella aestuarina BUZ 2]